MKNEKAQTWRVFDLTLGSWYEGILSDKSKEDAVRRSVKGALVFNAPFALANPSLIEREIQKARIEPFLRPTEDLEQANRGQRFNLLSAFRK